MTAKENGDSIVTIQSDETTPTAPDAAAHDEIDFTLAKQQENHRDAIALIREAHAIQVASLEEEIKRLTKELHDMGDNRDKWKAQCEANSEELTRLVAEAALQSRAAQDWQPAVLHILNTLDAPTGEHHERFRAGWASAIGQMSARIQALPSIKETT